MLKRIVKSVIRRGIELVRQVPALLRVAKWLLSRSSTGEAWARKLVGHSIYALHTVNPANLSDDELRVFIDLKDAMDQFGRSRQ